MKAAHSGSGDHPERARYKSWPNAAGSTVIAANAHTEVGSAGAVPSVGCTTIRCAPVSPLCDRRVRVSERAGQMSAGCSREPGTALPLGMIATAIHRLGLIEHIGELVEARYAPPTCSTLMIPTKRSFERFATGACWIISVPMSSTPDRAPIWVPETPPEPARSRNMSANRRRDTKPERAVRSLLHAAGLRYRVDLPVMVEGVRIRPDVAFTRLRLAVFIDGCFWHACPEHGSRPSKNPGYWGPKLAANVARGARHSELLRRAGWTVLRFWEHEPPELVAAAVGSAAGRLRAAR